MYLDKFTIYKSGNIIREVTFKKGLNLITDSTSNHATESGNNIGKSTLLRCIDYCLGASGDDLYTDPENKSKNEEVYNFLNSGDVSFELVLNKNNSPIVLTKSFTTPWEVDKKEVSQEEYEKYVKEVVFGQSNDKPSLRQIANKFIRLKTYQLENVIKFLYTTTSDETYESLYLFLFGFREPDLLKRKTLCSKKLKENKKHRGGYDSYKITPLKQKIKILEGDIAELDKKKSNLDISGSVKGEVEDLTTLREEISTTSMELSNIDVRIKYSEETIANLEESQTQIDLDLIRNMYEQAKSFNPKMQKSFEDVVSFHKTMLENKISFVRENLSPLERKYKELDGSLDIMLTRERDLLRQLSKQGALEDYDKINEDKIKVQQKIAEYKFILSEKKRFKDEKEELQTEMKEINNEISNYQERLDEVLEKFNSFFSAYSEKFYEEKYILTYDNEGANFKFYTDSVRGSGSPGKKKGQITAFDLAYLSYLEFKKSTACRFQLNDRMEEISVNQLKTSFEIANNIDGQFVVPILHDKIRTLSSDFIRENTILQLSGTDKFFKL